MDAVAGTDGAIRLVDRWASKGLMVHCAGYLMMVVVRLSAMSMDSTLHLKGRCLLNHPDEVAACSSSVPKKQTHPG